MEKMCMETYQRFLRRVNDLVPVPWRRRRNDIRYFSISFPSPRPNHWDWVYEVSIHDGSGKVKWLSVEEHAGIYAVLSLDDRSKQRDHNHARFDALKAKRSVIESELQNDSRILWRKLDTAAWLGFRRDRPGMPEEWDNAAEWAAKKLVGLYEVCGPKLRDNDQG